MVSATIARRGTKASLYIRDARVFDPAHGIDERADVVIEKGQIASISPAGKGKAPGSAETIDAAGRLLVPGFVDLHAHLRTPGREDEEDIATGTAAAAAGGYVTICAMPNTDPVVDDASVLSSLMESAEEEAVVRVAFLGAISRGQEGMKLADLWDMAEAGAVAFSDDGQPVTDAGLLRAAFQAARLSRLPLSLHCEDPDIAGAGVMNEGEVSARLGLTGIPCSAESSMVARDLAIAAYEGARVHFAHVSCASTVAQIMAARRSAESVLSPDKGESDSEEIFENHKPLFEVTCEVTPHHLTLTEADVEGLDTNLKMNPPVRSEHDRRALVKALAAGDIDCIATDHAPHAPQEKETPFEEAAFGVIGLETAFPVLYTELVEAGQVPLERLVLAMSTNPAKTFGLPVPSLKEGQEANLTLIDTEEEYTIDPSAFKSKSRNSAFAGRSVKGKVLLTIAAGRVAHKL